ncbi:hypothetical protein [Mycetocola zhujimingii]|uniref:hypothetical protein n=1 Tax=Mycetocola zhujimingii TaxID=2079792 RepID=UPI001304D0E7|nr:hypothetical protein [Mycetocola zhujimingii]
MSITHRNTGRLHSPFTEVREAARDQVLMTLASATGVLSVVSVTIMMLLGSGWN